MDVHRLAPPDAAGVAQRLSPVRHSPSRQPRPPQSAHAGLLTETPLRQVPTVARLKH